MVLPFVRELLADVEKTASFARTVPHLRAGAGRIRVSGLTPTAKSLVLALLHRAAARPLVAIVPDNRAAEELLPVLEAFCELTGAAEPQSVVSLPAYDALPFENLSPHPEIQEARATALWKIATGAAAIVVAPVAATAMRLRPAEFYADLARVVRRAETIEVDALLEHLQRVGYAPADVVEMPGQYALRGGILDVYSPEAERPIRIEFFGDEVESLRKFDPATQRSSNPADEAVLLPLTETPASEEILAAIHSRLSTGRVSGREHVIEHVVAAGGVSVFPGWELLAPIASGAGTLFDLIPEAAVLMDEGAAVERELEHFTARVEESHERSGMGNLVRPAELFLSAEEWRAQLERRLGGARSIWGSQEMTAKARPWSSPRSRRRAFMARSPPWWRRCAACANRAAASSWPPPIWARSSVWPTSSPNTVFPSVWATARALQAARPISMKPPTSPRT
jgi:transcription-repair coupling factor (superfamily II helicase)